MIKLCNSEEHGHMKTIDKSHLKINLNGHTHLKIWHLKINQKRQYFVHNYNKYTWYVCLTYVCFDMNLALEWCKGKGLSQNLNRII